mmetsp:Transcript_31745/g.101526  ORF Transcript_31745/g.101526 Transcript_31745/m.101526 type:complete len:228 (-) Transcript_31745:335-1018(-)
MFAGGASADLRGDRRSRRRSHRTISDRAVSAPPRPTARVIVPRDCATRARAARLAAALCAPAAAASATLALGVVRPLVRPRQLAFHTGPPAIVDGPACDGPACDGAVAPRAGDRAGGGRGGAAASPLLLTPLGRRGQHRRSLGRAATNGAYSPRGGPRCRPVRAAAAGQLAVQRRPPFDRRPRAFLRHRRGRRLTSARRHRLVVGGRCGGAARARHGQPPPLVISRG